jgi:alpha-amylase/alpha-mannosidase (GH57 family)
MTDPAATKYVCIHGHFYQPPRENPWLEAIEKEISAAPYHDWNERIFSECYRANTAARLTDEKNRILDLKDNYARLSFNFGPTLLSWLEAHQPAIYKAIIRADRDSSDRLAGHGNAIAQVYNHVIMPLANRRDKITQVRWAIGDFKHRFGRFPEGMWLAETAVDRETLDVLAEAGIRFTILSPFQANRWRFIDQEDSAWRDAKDGEIPTGRAYRHRCGNGKSIDLFFYDGGLARGIAFERLLEHSSKLIGGIQSSYRHRSSPADEPWLVHTATDGESYGHHFKFGDMALASALKELDHDPTVRVMNYAAFLDAFPVRAEVEIEENTAWSCAHGLGRWQRDCGCHIGGGPGWNQKWRGPLRESLDFLRDRLAVHYEREMGGLCKDPWEARNDYIQLLLDPNRERDAFTARHAGHSLSGTEAQRFFQLLEMQRCAMLMFTSCGWFFDEVSGLETAIILRYAARAIQLGEHTGGPPIEPQFLKILEKAPSNLPEFQNGANVYLEKAKPAVVSKDRVVANYAILSLARSTPRSHRIYIYTVSPRQEEDLGSNPTPGLYGHVTVRDDRTLEEADYLYAVLHFGGLDFRCSVKPYTSNEEYESILADLQKSAEEQSTVNMIRVLDGAFGPSSFGLHDAFRDLRSSIALEISRKTMNIYKDFQRHLFQVYRPLMASLMQWGIRIPSDLRIAIRRVLSDELTQLAVEIIRHRDDSESRFWEETDFFYRSHMGRLQSLLGDAKSWGVALQLAEASAELGRALVDTLEKCIEPSAPEDFGKLFRLINVCRKLQVRPQLWTSQTLYFKMVSAASWNPASVEGVRNLTGLFRELDSFLECRFAEHLLGLPAPRSDQVTSLVTT